MTPAPIRPSILATLLGVKSAHVEVIAPPSAARIRALAAEHAGAGLLEPDLPIGKLALPRDPIDRAVLALVSRGAPRALLFVRGERARLALPKDERALDLEITLVTALPGDDPLVHAATEVLLTRGAPIAGKELLREARTLRGGASTRDAAVLGRAVLRAWSAGLIELR